jgi:hypothetical protein
MQVHLANGVRGGARQGEGRPSAPSVIRGAKLSVEVGNKITCKLTN